MSFSKIICRFDELFRIFEIRMHSLSQMNYNTRNTKKNLIIIETKEGL